MGETRMKKREMVDKFIYERDVSFLNTKHRTLRARQIPFDERDETFSIDI